MNLKEKNKNNLFEENFEKILIFISNSKNIKNISEKLANSIILITKSIIIRTISPPPLEIIFADAKINLTAQNWNFLLISYKILYNLISNLDPSFVSHLITNEFIIDLVSLLSSPDIQEQLFVEKLLFLVFNSIPGFRQLIINSIIKLIRKYKENPLFFHSINLSLKFLLFYFKTLPLPLKATYFHLFQNLIFPLISLPFFNEFFSSFYQISIFFIEKDSSIALWSLNYLINHWPITDSSKQSTYLAHLIPITQSLSFKSIPLSIKKVFLKISDSLLCNNFKVTLTALELLLNAKFLFIFSSYITLIIPIIYKGLEFTSNHWNNDVKKLSNDAIRALFSLDSNNKFKLENLKSEDISKAGNWLIIAQFAFKNYKDIDFENIKTTIEKKFGF